MLNEITLFIEASKKAIDLFKDASALLPDSEAKTQINETITAAERELALSEAAMAKELGYQLCQCTFPPQIMLFTGKKRYQYQCNRCQFVIETGATAGFSGD